MIRVLDGAELVTRCRAIADQAAGIRRRGALVAAIVIDEASSVAKARVMLDDTADATVAPEIRSAAHGTINQVLTEATEAISSSAGPLNDVPGLAGAKEGNPG